MKYLRTRQKENPYLFLKIEVEMLKKNGGFWEEHDEFEKGLKGQDNEQLKVFEGKLKKF